MVKTFKVKTPKLKMPSMKISKVKNPSFKGMERSAERFGKGAESRIAKFNKGRV